MPGIKVGSHIFDSSVHLENAIPLKWGEVILTQNYTQQFQGWPNGAM